MYRWKKNDNGSGSGKKEEEEEGIDMQVVVEMIPNNMVIVVVCPHAVLF